MRRIACSRSSTRGRVTTRKWSGHGQLKAVPWTISSFSESSRSRTNFSSLWIGQTFGSIRGKAYSAPIGFTQLTPGMSLSSSQARLRCSSRRPGGRTRSLMLW